MKEEKFLETATALALAAAAVVMDLRLRPISASRKDDHSLVTEADLRSDEILREGFNKAFPDHAILSEENGLSGPTDSDRVWVIDPLDGTKAYARGIAGFSILVGLLKDGIPSLGVVIDPLERLVYQAIKGQGATLTSNGKRSILHVSNRREFAKMPLVTSTDFPSHLLGPLLKKLATPLVDPINSVGIKIGLLARQEADIYISHHPVHYWDSCAPQVILEEAGGQMTDLAGRELCYDLKNNPLTKIPIFASNGTRHEELVAILQSVLR